MAETIEPLTWASLSYRGCRVVVAVGARGEQGGGLKKGAFIFFIYLSPVASNCSVSLPRRFPTEGEKPRKGTFFFVGGALFLLVFPRLGARQPPAP